jgi:hypothetical protein
MVNVVRLRGFIRETTDLCQQSPGEVFRRDPGVWQHSIRSVELGDPDANQLVLMSEVGSAASR